MTIELKEEERIGGKGEKVGCPQCLAHVGVVGVVRPIAGH